MTVFGYSARMPLAPDHEPVTRLSFILALPFDVGYPNNSTSTVLDRNEIFRGWEGVDAVVFPGGMPLSKLLPHLDVGLRPATGFWFRRAKIKNASPFAVTDKTFGALLGRRGGLVGRLRDRVALLRAPSNLRGVEWRTAVQLTRISTAPSGIDPEGWVSDQFDLGLSKLNELLIATAAVARDSNIGPISRADLPMAVPFLLGPADGSAPTEKSLMLLHYGAQGKADDMSDEALSHAFNLAARQHGAGHPFFAMGEAMVESRRAFTRGRYGHAVLEMGVAFEVLVATVVREGGQARGYSPQKIQGILDAGLKNILTDHMPKLLGSAVDLDDPSTPFGQWSRDAYALRNNVVHRGHRPGEPEAAMARVAIHGVIDHIADRLSADQATSHLGPLLAAKPPQS